MVKGKEIGSSPLATISFRGASCWFLGKCSNCYSDLVEFQTCTAVASKKSPTGPSERTPKPEYLIVLATYLGVRW